MGVPKKVRTLKTSILTLLTKFYSFQGTKPGDVLKETYFLGTKTQHEKIGIARKASYYYKTLKCEICQRVFRFE